MQKNTTTGVAQDERSAETPISPSVQNGHADEGTQAPAALRQEPAAMPGEGGVQVPPPVKEAGAEKRKRYARAVLAAVAAVLFSGIVRALAIYMFTTPNEFAPGGINGIAVLLEELTRVNSGYFLIALNVPLFFVAFFLLGKKEAVISTLSMLLTSGLLIVFEYIPGMDYLQYAPKYNAIIAAVAGGVLLGLALAIMLRSCGTSGGTTVLASLVNKKFRNLSISAMTSAFDACVVLASFFVYHRGEAFTVKLDPVLLAIISLVVTSKFCDFVLQGFKVAYRFEIVTDHAEEIAAEIMTRLHHGVTEINATGMYSHANKSMLVCIIRKRQIGEVQRIIRKYPDTFASFSPVSEVYGKFLK